MSLRKGIATISNVLNRVVRRCVFLFTLTFALLLFTSVLFRYVIKHPLIFSVEVAKLLFIWSAFLAVTIGYKEKVHIRFEFLNRWLKPMGVACTEVLIRVTSGIFFALVLVYAIQFTRAVWPTFFPVLNMSQGWIYVSVIISMVILIVHSVDLSIEAICELQSVLRSSKATHRENTL